MLHLQNQDLAHKLFREVNRKAKGFGINKVMFAIETNGSISLSDKLLNALDHVCVSPKTSLNGRTVHCDEVKFVLASGMDVPKVNAVFRPRLKSNGPPARLISPADASPENINWCYRYVVDHPWTRLSIQQHKIHNWR